MDVTSSTEQTVVAVLAFIRKCIFLLLQKPLSFELHNHLL